MQGPLAGAAILFDLDGTLIDTADDLGAALNHALVSAGLPSATFQSMRGYVGHGAAAMLAKAIRDIGVADEDVDREALLREFLSYYEAHIADNSRPFPGVIEAIAVLRRDGARIAICTNKRERFARLLIEKLSLGALFEAIVGADTASAPKPDPAPLRECLRAVSVGRGVLVGDSDTDIAAGVNAGMPVIISELGYGPLERRREAHDAFSNFEQLPRIVRQALSARDINLSGYPPADSR